MNRFSQAHDQAQESSRVLGPTPTPPWLVDQLYARFLEDFWSRGAGELASTPLDSDRAPREAYARALEPRLGSGRLHTVRLPGQMDRAVPPASMPRRLA